MNIYKGNIITCDAKNTVAQYLIEDNGKILYVGNKLPTEYASGKIIELGKKALLPSFADTHIHFASFATFHAGLNVMDAKSNTELLDMLKNMLQRRMKNW